ncbi:hypothetical protein ACHAWF_012764, partial [Thalassiosira exigua]
ARRTCEGLDFPFPGGQAGRDHQRPGELRYTDPAKVGGDGGDGVEKGTDEEEGSPAKKRRGTSSPALRVPRGKTTGFTCLVTPPGHVRLSRELQDGGVQAVRSRLGEDWGAAPREELSRVSGQHGIHDTENPKQLVEMFEKNLSRSGELRDEYDEALKAKEEEEFCLFSFGSHLVSASVSPPICASVASHVVCPLLAPLVASSVLQSSAKARPSLRSTEPVHGPQTRTPQQRTMLVTYLELENFKSYAGLQRSSPFLNFTWGNSPNGSGKSNLLDAVPFVLRVQSTKLQSGQMKDLTFRSLGAKRSETVGARASFVTPIPPKSAATRWRRGQTRRRGLPQRSTGGARRPSASLGARPRSSSAS